MRLTEQQLSSSSWTQFAKRPKTYKPVQAQRSTQEGTCLPRSTQGHSPGPVSVKIQRQRKKAQASEDKNTNRSWEPCSLVFPSSWRDYTTNNTNSDNIIRQYFPFKEWPGFRQSSGSLRKYGVCGLWVSSIWNTGQPWFNSPERHPGSFQQDLQRGQAILL